MASTYTTMAMTMISTTTITAAITPPTAMPIIAPRESPVEAGPPSVGDVRGTKSSVIREENPAVEKAVIPL